MTVWGRQEGAGIVPYVNLIPVVLARGVGTTGLLVRMFESYRNATIDCPCSEGCLVGKGYSSFVILYNVMP